MINFFRRLFAYEEINGHNLAPTYLRRWRLAAWGPRGRKIYLHHFIGEDWAVDLHDHPKWFLSIGLKGGYYEESKIPRSNSCTSRWFQAPWVRWFPATHAHRIWIPKNEWTMKGERPSCWTLVFTGPKQREWGFWLHGQRWVPWEEFVVLYGPSRSITGQERCPHDVHGIPGRMVQGPTRKFECPKCMPGSLDLSEYWSKR